MVIRTTEHGFQVLKPSTSLRVQPSTNLKLIHPLIDLGILINFPYKSTPLPSLLHYSFPFQAYIEFTAIRNSSVTRIPPGIVVHQRRELQASNSISTIQTSPIDLISSLNQVNSNMTTFTIEIVSDPICPWCYIGLRRLQKAISTFQKTYPGGSKDVFKIVWKPYYLHPEAPDLGLPMKGMILSSYSC